MRLFGGEIESAADNVYQYLTDSGRSSLRLILQSSLRDKKFLVPDYLCEIVLKVFHEFSVDYSFYRVNDDLSIDDKVLKGRNFDVLYLINYFGRRHDLLTCLDEDITVVEDNVFLPDAETSFKTMNWVSFNSFRKISGIADGSLVKSTISLPGNLIERSAARFSTLKYRAKHLKYEFLNENRHSEKQYLNLFQDAEKMLDKALGIHFISTPSLVNLFKFYKSIENDKLIRRSNYETLDRYLKKWGVSFKTDYHSFYLLKVKRRDALKEYLFSKRIYLPVHWPRIRGIENRLYDCALSIPVDPRYNTEDMKFVARSIIGFLEK